MKKIIILIPVYNDWESLDKLLIEINKNIEFFNDINFECLIVNDASSINPPELYKPTNFKLVELLNMRDNKGHARCNAFGIRYIFHNKEFDKLILMDGDGEDRPEEIVLLVEKITENPNTSVVAKRIKRSEGPFFQILYQLHKLLTIISTGKVINFGNYSCLIKDDIKKLSTQESLWSSFSGSVKKHIFLFNTIDSIRGKRYFGPSKMSIYRLIIHSLSIIAVFKINVFIRSTILIFLSYYFFTLIKVNVALLMILIILFNILIYLVSLRENKKELLSSELNIEKSKVFTH